MNVLEMLKTRRENRTATAAQTYAKLVGRITAGEELSDRDVASIEKVAEELGRAPDAIAADVELIRQHAAASKAGDAVDEAQAAHDAAKAAQEAMAQERIDLTADLSRREQQAQADFATTLGAVGAARRAAADAERLRAERPDLFNE